MKVKTMGNRNAPAVIMIPGMFCTSDMPARIASLLQDEYYFILPTLDGHHAEEPVYHSKEEDGRKIIEWLHQNGVEEITLLQGTSMGAEVALETARQSDIPISRFLFDGGPFFHFPRFFRVFMAGKFMRFMKLVRGKEKEEAIDALMQDPFVKWLGGSSLESYRGLMDGFCEVGQWIGRDSVRRIADTCYQCDLPDFDREKTKNFTFLYSEKEPAGKSLKRLRKKYPDAVYLSASGYGHGGLQSQDPEKYAELMRIIIEGDSLTPSLREIIRTGTQLV